MADAIVGTWKGRPEDVVGMKEYYAAIGKSKQMATMDIYNKPFSTVISKTGDNSYKSESTLDGSSTSTSEKIVIGEKSTSSGIPGFSSVEMESAMEGNNIVSIGNAEGIEIKTVLYVEGSCLFWEASANGATVSGHYSKA